MFRKMNKTDMFMFFYEYCLPKDYKPECIEILNLIHSHQYFLDNEKYEDNEWHQFNEKVTEITEKMKWFHMMDATEVGFLVEKYLIFARYLQTPETYKSSYILIFLL